MRHLTNRAWRNNARTAWVRGFDEAGQRVTYRLFRRSSVTRAFSSCCHTFPSTTERVHIASTLRTARRELREHVDAADLRHMGYSDA